MKKIKVQNWITLQIPATFLLASLFHFLYSWFPNVFFAAIFPVNESVFEHLKLIPISFFLWMLIGLFFVEKNDSYFYRRYAFSTLISVLVTMLLIPIFFYVWKWISSYEALWLHLLNLLFSIAIGTFVGQKAYSCTKIPLWVTGILFLALFIVLAYLTFHPWMYPIFQDPLTGRYGLQ